MKNTIKAFSKQFFGAKYESAGKSLLASAILFIALCAAEFRVEIAPFIFYLTSAIFTAGVMWQVLTGRRHMETMQGLFMLPFDNRSFVFSYVWVLAAHTLITKTLLLFALQSAVLSAILGWKFPIRDWKTESDLWHHPRKYLVPVMMLMIALAVSFF